jgi:hypothetical protein
LRGFPTGRFDHRRYALIDRRVQPRPAGFTNTSTGFEPTEQFDETRGQWLHEIVLFPQGLSELGSDSPVITAVSEVAGGLTSAVPSLFHGATRYAGWTSRGNAARSTWFLQRACRVYVCAPLEFPAICARALAGPRDAGVIVAALAYSLLATRRHALPK